MDKILDFIWIKAFILEPTSVLGLYGPNNAQVNKGFPYYAPHSSLAKNSYMFYETRIPLMWNSY